MKQKIYEVLLTGQTDIILHQDNIDGAEKLDKWRKDPRNKELNAKGDDRSPAWTWVYYLYHDLNVVTIDSDCIMSCLTEAGKSMAHPSGKGNQSLKSQVQSILVNEIGWPLVVKNHQIKWEECEAMIGNTDFQEHRDFAHARDFTLFVKRARIGAAKHIRVRPRFQNWTASGTITVTDLDVFSEEVLESLFRVAGNAKGLCDWRPSSGKPGPYGRFDVTFKEIK